MSKNKAKTVEEFDRRFDEGESIFELAEVTSVSRPNLEVQRVNVDFPKHFLLKLDREAVLRGVSRQALIKMWLYERLQFATAGSVLTAGNVAAAGTVSYDQLTPLATVILKALEAAPKSGIYEEATSKLLSGLKTRSK
jgi:hypothetical protein